MQTVDFTTINKLFRKTPCSVSMKGSGSCLSVEGSTGRRRAMQYSTTWRKRVKKKQKLFVAQLHVWK